VAPDEPTDPVAAAAGSITPERIAATIDALAHDTALGRGTPSPELDEAAAWLAAELEAAGVVAGGTDGYLQPFDYVPRGVEGERASVGLEGDGIETPSLEYGQDYIMFSPEVVETTAPLLWAGDITARPTAPDVDADGAILLFDHPLPDLDLEWVEALIRVYGPLAERDMAGIALVLSPEIDSAKLAARMEMIESQRFFYHPVVLLTAGAAGRLAEAAGTSLEELRAGGTPRVADAFRVHAPRSTAIARPSNVVAVVPGADPALRNRYVVVSAHYDHLGIGFAADGDSVYNGADDNASGTAGLLEVARAMAALDTPPARSVLFLATAAEEKGLLGASHFVDRPTVPRIDIVANINLDMISRNTPARVAAIGKDYTTMGDQIDSVLAEHPDIGLTASHQGGSIYVAGSDHAPFVLAGIPAVFLFAGLHDDYHEPSDEPLTNDDGKAARVARLAFHLAHAVASHPDPVAFTELGRSEIGTLRNRDDATK
jgi:hypothetical protein